MLSEPARLTERAMVELSALHREPWVLATQAALLTAVMGLIGGALGPGFVWLGCALALPQAPAGALLVAAVALAPAPASPGIGLALAALLFGAGLVLPHVLKDRVDFERMDNLGARRLAKSLALLPVAAPLLIELALLRLGHRPALSARLEQLDRALKGRRAHLPWRNWGRTASCVPVTSARPTTLEELQAAVLEGARRGMRVRAVTSGYSWSTLAVTQDMLIHCERLNRVEVDVSDPDHPRVVCEVGATNRQINDALEAAGLALPSNVVLEVVRIGGLVATGSHGSGWSCPTVSDYVRAVDMVMADGSLRRFEVGVDDPELMDAVRLSLGAFGVMWRVTLDVVPAHDVRMRDETLPWDEVMEDLGGRVRAADALDLFWFPGTEDLWVKTVERTDAPRSRGKAHISRRSTLDAVKGALDAECYRALSALTRLWPGINPWLGRMTLSLGVPMGERVVPRADAVHYRRHADLPRLVNVEVAFKVDEGFDAVRQAMEDFRRITAAWNARGEQPLTTALNLRFIHNSSALLSPASGPGHTCYIEVLSFRGTPGWQAYTRELAEAWFKLPGAAPHWAKQWEHLPGVDALIARRYGPRLRRFCELQRQLDPEGRFHNRLLDRVLACARAQAHDLEVA